MRRTGQVLTVALVVAAVAMLPAGGLAAGDGVAAQQTTPQESPANETDDGATERDAVAPGERLGGVVAVGQSEHETAVESRAFGLRIAGAASQNATADVVGDQFADVEERVDALERRTAALERARGNGSLSEGAYRARMAAVAAELRGTQRLANQTANASQGLPADLLAARGIDVTAIGSLQQRASELGGPAVAEIARSIAGNSVGEVPDHAGPDRRGPPGETPGSADRGNATERGPDEQPTDRSTDDRRDGSGDAGDSPDGSTTATATETRQRGPGSNDGDRP